ncbi:MAG: NUDIX domain-containing protein [Asticcacaulis sp.]|nr:NUDIX domain-containing protein [Asticcacaulis sp.]
MLLAQRPPGKTLAGLWEFPGGKVEPGETPEETIVREVREEIGIETRVACLAPLTFASHSYEDFHLFDAALCLPPLLGHPRAPGRAGAEMGAAAQHARLPDAAGRPAADPAPHRPALTGGADSLPPPLMNRLGKCGKLPVQRFCHDRAAADAAPEHGRKSCFRIVPAIEGDGRHDA